jgi:hypothetical protein
MSHHGRALGGGQRGRRKTKRQRCKDHTQHGGHAGFLLCLVLLLVGRCFGSQAEHVFLP